MRNSLNIDSLKISWIKLLLGLTIGFLFAFFLYSFAIVIREAIRVFSVSYEYEMWVLSEDEVHFYNLIYAFVAVIFGQSICFTFWLDRPRRNFGKFSRKIRTIINDQRVLNWYFLNWFTKLAFVFGLMFGAASYGGYYAISFYPEYNFLFILIIVVLFLQSWTTIRLLFRKKSLKWMLVSAACICVLSFGMSYVDVVDYKTLNESFLSRNVYHKYKLELPESNYYKVPQRFSLVEKIYIGFAIGDSINPKPKIVVPGNVEIDFEDLPMYFENWRMERDEYDLHRMEYIVHIHKEIKMDFVNKLHKQFAHSNARRIAYAVLPPDRDMPDRFYQLFNFPVRVSYLAPWEGGDELYHAIDTFAVVINIKALNGKVEMNDKMMDIETFKEELQILFRDNSSNIVKFYIKDDDTFESYFNVISKIWEASYELREEFSQAHFSDSFEFLDGEERRIIKRKYPIRIYDMTEERVKKYEANSE